MAVISLPKFSGVAPRVAPNKLTPEMAQVAENVRLLAGTLSSWKQPVTVASGFTPANQSTIYRFGQDLISDTQYWFHWTVGVDVVKGAISNDQTERTFFLHPTEGLRQTNNSLALVGGSGDFPRNSVPLGVAAPTLTPGVAIATQGDQDSPLETRIYAFTFVTSLGEESAPSPVSPPIDVRTGGGTVTVSNLGTAAPSGFVGYITGKRIYRTLSGNLRTEFQLVDEIPIAQATYTDTISSTQLDEVIPTATWLPPPSDLVAMAQMANGILVVFTKYDVCPSEAYVPYAYPLDYQLAVDFPIVGAAAVGSSAVVLTTGQPYLLTGSDPSAMSLIKLESQQACVSKRSIAAVDGGVIYASPDGLIFVSGTGQVSNMTEQLFSRDEWQALVPSSMHGYFHDGRYHGFYNAGLVQRGFVFDPRQGAAAFTFVDTYATAGYSDLVQDALYLKVNNNIVKWDAGSTRTSYTWRSAVFELTTPTNPACAQVVARSYPVTFRLFSDGTLRHTQTVANADPFWLPSGYRTRFVEVEIAGTAEVLSVHVASSPQELKQV
jgi:hypothetical protein